MGRRWGRPDMSRYADRFDVPAADDGLAVTFLGVASLLVSDGTSAVLTDGFFSRPSLPRVLLRRIAPDPGRIHEALGRAGVSAVDAVVPVHTYYDHALESATVAAATGARLLGGASAAHIGVGGGLPEDRVAIGPPGEPVACGRLTLTLVESAHCPPDRYPGVIEDPVVPPAYRCGEAWSIFLEHASGRTPSIHGSGDSSAARSPTARPRPRHTSYRRPESPRPPACSAEPLHVVWLCRGGQQRLLQVLGGLTQLAVQARVVQRQAGWAGDVGGRGEVDRADRPRPEPLKSYVSRY